MQVCIIYKYPYNVYIANDAWYPERKLDVTTFSFCKKYVYVCLKYFLDSAF